MFETLLVSVQLLHGVREVPTANGTYRLQWPAGERLITARPTGTSLHGLPSFLAASSRPLAGS